MCIKGRGEGAGFSNRNIMTGKLLPAVVALFHDYDTVPGRG